MSVESVFKKYGIKYDPNYNADLFCSNYARRLNAKRDVLKELFDSVYDKNLFAAACAGNPNLDLDWLKEIYSNISSKDWFAVNYASNPNSDVEWLKDLYSGSMLASYKPSFALNCAEKSKLEPTWITNMLNDIIIHGEPYDRKIVDFKIKYASNPNADFNLIAELYIPLSNISKTYFATNYISNPSANMDFLKKIYVESELFTKSNIYFSFAEFYASNPNADLKWLKELYKESKNKGSFTLTYATNPNANDRWIKSLYKRLKDGQKISFAINYASNSGADKDFLTTLYRNLNPPHGRSELIENYVLNNRNCDFDLLKEMFVDCEDKSKFIDLCSSSSFVKEDFLQRLRDLETFY